MTRRLQSITSSKLPAAVALAAIVLFWFVLSETGIVPGYMLPSPVDVIRALTGDFPIIITHAGVTLQEAFYGLGIGILLAFITATLMDHFLILNQAFISDHDHHPDHTDHRHRAGAGALDGIWHGAEDHTGGDHHIFSDHGGTAGRLQECGQGFHRPDASHGSLKAADLLACEVSRRFAAVFCGIEDILFLCGGGRSHLGMAGRI